MNFLNPARQNKANGCNSVRLMLRSNGLVSHLIELSALMEASGVTHFSLWVDESNSVAVQARFQSPPYPLPAGPLPTQSF